MNPAEMAGLRYRVCTRKTPMSRGAAMAAGQRLRAEHLSAYRCPFVLEDWDDDEHWHLGHAPNMKTLERIAEMLRDRHNGQTSTVVNRGQAR